MITADTVSFQSLSMIRDELVVTIEQAARDLEVFVSDGNDNASFSACLQSIQQIIGVLSMLELKGARMLAEELFVTAEGIAPGGDTPILEKQLELVSNTFFVLTRYLEYVQGTEKATPVLLIPYINELKKFRRQPLLPESSFFDANLSVMPPVPDGEGISVADGELTPLVVRLRHMYQFGLIGVLNDSQLDASLSLMRRSLNRLQRLGGDRPLSILWWMGCTALDAAIQTKMTFNEPRKLLFSRIDRIIRQVQKDGFEAFDVAPPKVLIKELLYFILLSGVENRNVTGLKSVFKVKALPYTDKVLDAERQVLQGPSAHTMSSLVRVLRIEINNIKKVLETAAQGSGLIDDIEGLVQALVRIAETLGVVGLVGPRSILKQEIALVEGWTRTKELEDSELHRTAKVLLYTESAVASLENSKLSRDSLLNTSQESQEDMISSSELALAERIVLAECEAGIALTKRAITSYAESNFDSGHIINIAKTLSAVRGGLLILGRDRAAQVLEACVAFINEVLLQKTHPPELKELLETFADAIISIEYFMNTSGDVHRLDDAVLQVAEESLVALGFSIAG